jgi:N-acetyl-gamma-glutamyl-phosphate reductase
MQKILMFHPHAKLDFVYSTTNAGKPSIAHHDLMGYRNELYRYGESNVNVVFFV